MIRNACAETFRVRAEHNWPPHITLPKAWENPLVTMAADLELSITSLEETQLKLRKLVHSIVHAPSESSNDEVSVG